jgi:hypothetical protein
LKRERKVKAAAPECNEGGLIYKSFSIDASRLRLGRPSSFSAFSIRCLLGGASQIAAWRLLFHTAFNHENIAHSTVSRTFADFVLISPRMRARVLPDSVPNPEPSTRF